MSQLYRIVYCSRSNLTGSRGDIEVQTRRILSSARRNNRAANTSGAMAFNENWFAQVLEGALDDLGPIFARIRIDSRHRDLKILQKTKTTRRLFPMWSMAYANMPDHQGQHPLAHFGFESALTAGALPEARQLLDALCRTVIAGRSQPQS